MASLTEPPHQRTRRDCSRWSCLLGRRLRNDLLAQGRTAGNTTGLRSGSLDSEPVLQSSRFCCHKSGPGWWGCRANRPLTSAVVLSAGLTSGSWETAGQEVLAVPAVWGSRVCRGWEPGTQLEAPGGLLGGGHGYSAAGRTGPEEAKNGWGQWYPMPKSSGQYLAQALPRLQQTVLPDSTFFFFFSRKNRLSWVSELAGNSGSF